VRGGVEQADRDVAVACGRQAAALPAAAVTIAVHLAAGNTRNHL
jgi:hypothetical protein